MEGVSIENKSNKQSKSTTEEILEDKDMMESIRRGERDLAQGNYIEVTSADIDNILGL